MFEESPVGESQFNGLAAAGLRCLEGQLPVIKAAFEERDGISASHAIYGALPLKHQPPLIS